MHKLRVRISGIMWTVVAIAVGVAALWDASPFSFGAIHLLTQLTLGLAILLAIYRRGAARAWWLGFALFGWGYEYAIPPDRIYRVPHLPVTMLLLALGPLFGHLPHVNPAPGTGGMGHRLADYLYLRIGDDLAAMVVALLGGVLARVVFAIVGRTGSGAGGARPGADPGNPWRSRWIGPIFAAWAALVLIAGFAAIRLTWTAGFWAGIAFLLTFGLLGLAGLGAVFARGRSRRSYTGARAARGRLSAAGVLAQPVLAAAVRPVPARAPRLVPGAVGLGGPGQRPDPRRAGAAHPDELPRAHSTVGSAGLCQGIHGDPGPSRDRDLSRPHRPPGGRALTGLDDRDRSPERPPEGLAAHRAGQLGMDYVVTNGLLWVTSMDTFSSEAEADSFYAERGPYHHDQFQHRQAQLWLSADLADPYLIAGHCLLSLVMAGVGAVAGMFLARAGGLPTSDQSDPT